jgi:hypothetical protein
MDSGIFACDAKVVGESEEYSRQTMAPGCQMLAVALLGAGVEECESSIGRGGYSDQERGNAYSGAIFTANLQEKARWVSGGQAGGAGSIIGSDENRVRPAGNQVGFEAI